MTAETSLPTIEHAGRVSINFIRADLFHFHCIIHGGDCWTCSCEWTEWVKELNGRATA